MMMTPAGRPRTEFTPDQKAQALATLAKNDGNLAKTSQEIDISAYLLKKLRLEYPEQYEAARRTLVDDLYDKTVVVANRYADELLRRIEDDETLHGMKLKDVAVVLGIAIDKVNVMTTVRSKFGDAQKAADRFTGLNEGDLERAVEAEFKEITIEQAEEPTKGEPTKNEPTENEPTRGSAKEGVSDTPKDELSIKPFRVPALGSFIHSGGGTEGRS